MTSIKINTDIPGPKCRKLGERRMASVANAHGSVSPIYVSKTEGCYITDVDGNTFLDFAGGIGSMNSGHCHPKILNKVKYQLEHYLHVCFSVSPYEPYILLAEKLNSITPGRFNKKTLLVNSGAEAVENAIKVARCYTNRSRVVVFESAFHGRTFMSMSLTHKENPYKKGFGPLMPEVYRLPFPYKKSSDGIDKFTIPLYKLLDELSPDTIGAIVIELVLGEGGFMQADPTFIHELRNVCTKHGIVLVIDEVQTGLGRTGKMFACDWYELEPDIITLAKSMSGGLPISAVVGKAEMIDSVHVGGLGGTFGGNPLSCQSALGAIEIIENLIDCGRLEQLAYQTSERMDQIAGRSKFISDSRGIGCMYSLEVCDGTPEKNPSKEKAEQIQNGCLQDGLLMILSGEDGNVIRTHFPLSITDNDLEIGMSIIEKHLLE